jgi:hypothetical protein
VNPEGTVTWLHLLAGSGQHVKNLLRAKLYSWLDSYQPIDLSMITLKDIFDLQNGKLYIPNNG